MRIARLSKIKEHRVFRDFLWPEGLPAFAQVNVIYGWNGTGKTTLSSIYAHLQDGRPITQGEVEFELDNGAKILGTEISESMAPPVRVFNRDFITKTIEAIGQSNVAPIYFLGEKSIEQQKQVETLKVELESARKVEGNAGNDKQKADEDLDDFCIEKARLIKETLLGSLDHANYDKRRFKQSAAALQKVSPPPAPLTEAQKKSFRKQKNLQAKPAITQVSVSIPNLEKLRALTSSLLNRTIVSQVIDALASDSTISNWVKEGIPLHKGEFETDICRFCSNEISAGRRADLEAHFNDEFNKFQQEIDHVLSNIAAQRSALSNVSFPDGSRFYDHLAGDYNHALEKAIEGISTAKQLLEQFMKVLGRKKANPFQKLSSAEIDTLVVPDELSLQGALEAVNDIIDKHEDTTNNLNDEIRKACRKLEQDYVLEALPKFEALCTSVAAAEIFLRDVRQKPLELSEQVKVIERKIVEHRRPAEELNRELRAYLGRNELQFEIKDTGYSLTRGGQPALHLSEGERTAIAFLYFLKSLEDRAFDLGKGVVVIDDPVSSLDANALFSAFGYMRERTKSCHQLFILTHNFAFFRQVKNWIHHLKGQNKTKIELRPGRFYALLATVVDGERNATLSTIDPLLEQFESEYHFLFRQVFDVANAAEPAAALAQYYGLPNIARRLIETFLAYRFPDASGDLIKRFDRVDFDPAKKTRVLRLLNTYSHSGGISDPEHDPSVLAETFEVMKVILELMQAVDAEHYDGMVNLMQPVEAEGGE